jgi:hypothetical protein
MLQATFSQCWYKLNNVFDYCAVQLYLHAFSATTLDRDMTLISNSDGEFPTQRATGRQCIPDMAWQPERTDWIKGSSLANLWEPKHIRPDGRLVTIYSELRRLQAKYPYIFNLHSNALSGQKEGVLCYLSQLYIIFISATQIAYKEYIHLSRMFKITEGCVPFPKPVSLSGTSSLDYSPYWQWSVLYSTNWLTSMLFFFNSINMSFTVALSGILLQYAT